MSNSCLTFIDMYKEAKCSAIHCSSTEGNVISYISDIYLLSLTKVCTHTIHRVYNTDIYFTCNRQSQCFITIAGTFNV